MSFSQLAFCSFLDVRFPTDGAEDDTASISLGPISISWRTFYVAFMGEFSNIVIVMVLQGLLIKSSSICISQRLCICFAGSLIVLPPNMLIMFLFQRSRPFIPPSQRQKIKQSTQAREALPVNHGNAFEVESDPDKTENLDSVNNENLGKILGFLRYNFSRNTQYLEMR